MALESRSRDPLADGRHRLPSTALSLLLAAVAAIVVVLGIYSITHAVGPDAQLATSMAQTVTPRPAPVR